MRPRVLVVDSDRDLRGLLADAITKLGAEVREAEDGLEALDSVAFGQRFAVVVTALALDRLNGAELLRALRESDCGAALVVFTGSAGEAFNLEYLPSGTRVFRKPDGLEALLQYVGRRLRLRVA